MKTWLLRIVALLVLVVVSIVGYVVWRAQRTTHPVGFEQAVAQDARGRRFPLAIWYPTRATPRPTTLIGLTLMSVAPDAPVEGERLPLIVISHGNLGGPASHADLAMALADAGYVVVAPMHTGDNFRDGSGTGVPGFWSGRNRQLQAALDYMTAQWNGRAHLDPARIGAYGFSAGGFTVLTAVGARPDLARVATHCAQHQEFACDVLRSAHSALVAGKLEPIDRDFHVDPRIRAAVVAAPGLGFTFEGGGLEDVRVPLQLWTGGRDVYVPEETNTALVRDALGSRVESHVEAGAVHMSFLAPCVLFGPPILCSDVGDFDRAAFHRRMNADVVRFFDAQLRK